MQISGSHPTLHFESREQLWDFLSGVLGPKNGEYDDYFELKLDQYHLSGDQMIVTDDATDYPIWYDTLNEYFYIWFGVPGRRNLIFYRYPLKETGRIQLLLRGFQHFQIRNP